MKRTLFSSARSTLTTLASFFALAGIALSAGATSWEPACDETRTGLYAFEKLDGSHEHPVKISVCPDVECSTHKDFATVDQDTYSAPAPKELLRPYFQLERQGERQIIGARRLALEGAYNFRDLGGLRTEDGKTIRWGKVFRSDNLTKLTAADYARLNALGISLVCDLRTRDERKADPTVWQDSSPMFLLAPLGEDAKGGSAIGVGRMINAGSVEEGRDRFQQFYIHQIMDSAPKFGAVLRAIATSDQPAMFHCTGGRDRTGITAALLERMLGVPKETIYSDYVLSTKYLSERHPPLSVAGLDAKQAEMLAQVTELQPRYLQGIFQAIDEKYGSFDHYRRDALRVSDEDVRLLRARLLE